MDEKCRGPVAPHHAVRRRDEDEAVAPRSDTG